MIHFLWPCITAFLAGVINSLAGGGTLLTFPALMAALKAGDESVDDEVVAAMANATSTIALAPASLSSAWAYREELAAVQHWLRLLALRVLAGVSLISNLAAAPLRHADVVAAGEAAAARLAGLLRGLCQAAPPGTSKEEP